MQNDLINTFGEIRTCLKGLGPWSKPSALWSHIVFFNHPDLYHKSPDSGERQHKSRAWKRRFDGGSDLVEMGGVFVSFHDQTGTLDLPLFLITSPYIAHCLRACGAKGERNLFSLSLSPLSLASLHRAEHSTLSATLSEAVENPDMEGDRPRQNGRGLRLLPWSDPWALLSPPVWVGVWCLGSGVEGLGSGFFWFGVWV